MLKHNIHLFFRRLLRNRTHLAITISGMVLALTAPVPAFTFVSDERNFDRFHANGGNIFRVNKWNTETSDRSKMAEPPGLMAGALGNDLPEVTTASRAVPWCNPVLVSHDDKDLKIEKWVFDDSNFLSFFNFNLLQGNGVTALQGPGKLFAYHIDAGWWLWVVPGIALPAIVFVTVSFKSIRPDLLTRRSAYAPNKFFNTIDRYKFMAKMLLSYVDQLS